MWSLIVLQRKNGLQAIKLKKLFKAAEVSNFTALFDFQINELKVLDAHFSKICYVI